jgi:DNA (cytosine-5)-methyltransferase 1
MSKSVSSNVSESKLLTYISLFSGAGVGCYGFKMNDFECVATNEILPKRLNVQIANKKCKYKTGYLEGDIQSSQLKSCLFKEIEKWKTKHNLKELDVVIATPPCQGMSVANHKKKNENQRNSLVVQSLKIIQKVQPKFFILENVRTFLNTKCQDSNGQEKAIGEAINFNLGGNYNILSQVVNLKNYGANSSRTRTLVIGVRKDIENISPYDLFPREQVPKTLRELIGDLPSLTKMGEISKDIYHSYREFNPKMLFWIEKLKEGQSAFQNKDKLRTPHTIIKSKVVFNKSKNGDKYARWYWDREGPCIHTRNDILSSQNTIHPSDNRVFSIREVMRMMSIPNSFKWTNWNLKKLNQLTLAEKKDFLKKEELNIRQCLGEAVPTAVFFSIAQNIKETISKRIINSNELKRTIEENKLTNPNKLINYINTNFNSLGLDNTFLIAEHSNSQRQATSAYFTRKDIAYTLVKDLPQLKKKKIKILEPAGGIGNFLPLLIDKYKEKEEIIIDTIDIDKNSLKVLKTILDNLSIPSNFKIRLKNFDFLLWKTKTKYDLVVGNPPYKKIVNNPSLINKYKIGKHNKDTNNLFSYFIEKSLKLGNFVSLIVPKSLINAPEFNKTRELLLKYDLLKIGDYGEKGFKGVKIETISFLVDTSLNKKKQKKVIIESFIDNSYSLKAKDYVFDKKFPYWLIYRNKKFDEVIAKMKLNIFQSFRDRQITKSLTKSKGKIRVLKSRNIGSNEIKELKKYDCYIDDYKNLTVSKFLNQDKIVMVPNLTYHPRATFLPKNTIADGSVALLTRKNDSRLPTEKDLSYYNSTEFESYYRIARNFGTRSLNIDKNSVYFFGLLKNYERENKGAF